MHVAGIADQKVRGLIRFVSSRSVPAISKFMGMILLIYAAWSLYNFSAREVSDSKLTVLIGALIIVVCGTLILLDFSFNINRSIGLYAVAIGGNRFFKFSNYLVMDGDTELITAVIFIFSIVMMGVSLNLCYSGYIFLRGETRGRTSMTFSASFMVVVTFAIMIVLTQTMGVPITTVITIHPEYVIMIAMYLILICMLGTETVRLSCRDEHYLSILNGIRKIHASSDQAYIYRGQAKVLSEAFRNRDEWMRMDDDGPVEAEYSFELYNRADDRSYVTVQKWKGEDELYFTISDHNSGSLFNAYRFACTDIVPEGPSDAIDKLTLYGKDVQMQIIVKEEPERKRWGLNVI